MKDKGQALFEIVFAVGIASLVLIGVVSLVTTSVRNTDFAQNETSATKLTQEATEWLRKERDENWTAFASYSVSDPGKKTNLGKLEWGLSDNEVPGTHFTREVVLETLETNKIEATVSVSWKDSQGRHSVESITRYTDWTNRL